MPSRSIAVAVLAALACACGDDDEPQGPVLPAEDYSASFTGPWFGTLELTVDGELFGRTQETTAIVREGHNRIAFSGPCPDGSQTHALVVGPESFTVSASTCSAVALTGCAAVTVGVSGGSGTVASGALALVIDGTMSGCGQSFALRMEFVGARDMAPPPPPPPTIPALDDLSQPLSALAAGEGSLVVPAGRRITAWRIATLP